MSWTVIVNDAWPVLPCESLALQVTVVVPSGKVEPEAGAQLTAAIGPSCASVAVGVTEAQAMRLGRPVTVITYPYAGAAYGWAMEDTSGFCKLIADSATRTLLGAHIIGYQASMLVQLLVQGMHLGSTVDEMATGQVWIHPALSEVVEQALLALIEALPPLHASR